MTKLYTDLMIDWETKSTYTNAHLMQVGLCFFDIADPAEVYASTQIKLKQSEQVAQRRHISEGTKTFWEREDPTLYASLQDGIYTMANAVELFCNVYGEHAAKGCRVWGNGSSFDETLTRSMFESVDRHTPYAFFKVRDMRTKLEDWPVEKVVSKVKHCGEADAIAQALTLKKCSTLERETKEKAWMYDELDH